MQVRIQGLIMFNFTNASFQELLIRKKEKKALDIWAYTGFNYVQFYYGIFPRIIYIKEREESVRCMGVYRV